MFCNAKKTLLVILACAFAFIGCQRNTPTAGNVTPAPQSSAPIASRPPDTSYPMPPVTTSSAAVGWTLTNAQHVKLSDYRGKIVVLDFYATWCEPCRDSIPHLIELQNRYGSQGLQVIGLNLGGQDDYDEVPKFAREFQIQYPLGIPDSELEHLYITENAIPQTMIIGRNGQLLKKFVGYGDSMADELESVIQGSLNPQGAKQAGQ